MSIGPTKFSDLSVRMASGAVIAIVGLGLIWLGGVWFVALVGLTVGLMVWELVRMLTPGAPGTVATSGTPANRAVLLGCAAAAAVILARLIPPGFALPLLFLPALAGLSLLKRNRTLYIVFTILIMIAGFGLLVQREDFGFVWIAWLIAVVIVTDVFGYFAGRLIGGPKFWPKVSPKKTWSGTAAGWVAAAIVGAVFMAITGAGTELIGVSVALSMASQIGDIAESAVKRKMGVKDASALIPGHGGVLDRFDGMLGASVFLLIIQQLVDFPPGLSLPI